MTVPYSLTSTVTGLSAWCYDFDRNPTNDDKTTYTATAENGDYIMPVSKTLDKYDTAVHNIHILCDVNHVFPGTGYLTANGAYTAGTTSSAYIRLNDVQYYSHAGWTNLQPVKDVVVSGVALENENQTPYTTTSTGIKIIDQTGIVHSNRGYGFIVFSIANGYSIPANTIITVNGTAINENTGAFGNARPLKFTTTYDMTQGDYLIRITDDQQYETGSVDIPTVTQAQVQKYTVSWDLTNCSVSPADTSLEQGTHTWTFKADPGYYFDKPGGIMNDNTGGFGNEIQATGTDTTALTYDLNRDIEVLLVASKLQSKTIPLAQTLTNATSNVSGSNVDRKINQIIITANNGYQLKDEVLVQLYTGSTVTQSFSVAGNGSITVTLPFNTNTQNTITDTMTNIAITASAVKPEITTGYAHYYAITNTELHQFSKEQIWNISDLTADNYYDVSKFIDNLIELPFKYDLTELPTNPIAVGRVVTSTTSHELKDRVYTLDFGKITVPAKYKNGYDYQIRSCMLYLPFAPAVSIAIDNAMEQTIHIVYRIDMSAGNGSVTLDNNGVPFNTININLSNQLPFLNRLKNTIIKDGQHQIDNDIRTPYLVIIRNQPILDSKFYPTNEQNKITNYSGRIQATLLDDTGITDNDDLSELQNILSNGVIYNA